MQQDYTQQQKHHILVEIAHKSYQKPMHEMQAYFSREWHQEWRDYLAMLAVEDPDKCYSYRRGKQHYYHSKVAQCHIRFDVASKMTRGICYGFYFYILPLMNVVELLRDLRYLVWQYMY